MRAYADEIEARAETLEARPRGWAEWIREHAERLG
jgi:hypothetical protein